MNTRIKGIFVPVVTPFSGLEESLDLGMLRYNIERLNETEVRGYMPLGSNGEFFMMTEDECCQVVDAVKHTSSKEKLVFAGTGRESEKCTVEFTKRVAAVGADAVFVLTPHYFPKQMNQECLKHYYENVAEQSPVPVILYQAPAYAAGVSLTIDTVAQLSVHPNIVGMKGTASETAANYRKRMETGAGFAILAGTFGAFCQNVRDGADGGVLSCANYIPQFSCELYRLLNVDGNGAESLYNKLAALIDSTIAPYGVGGVKMAMNVQGYRGGRTRNPLRYPEEGQVRNTKLLFERGGLICK